MCIKVIRGLQISLKLFHLCHIAEGDQWTLTRDEEDRLLYSSGEEEEGEYEVSMDEELLLLSSDEEERCRRYSFSSDEDSGPDGAFRSTFDFLSSPFPTDDKEEGGCDAILPVDFDDEDRNRDSEDDLYSLSMISDEEENLCFLEDIDVPYCFTFTPPRPYHSQSLFEPDGTMFSNPSTKRKREESQAEQLSVKRLRTSCKGRFKASSPIPLDLYDFDMDIAVFDPFALDEDTVSPLTNSGLHTSRKRNREESDIEYISRKMQRTSFEETLKASSPVPSDLEDFDDDIAAFKPFALGDDSDSD